MTAAGIGWGFYTLVGRQESDALSGTAANFVVALPITLVSILAISGSRVFTAEGLALALISGAVTSGLGYALWYRVLPHLAAAVAGSADVIVTVNARDFPRQVLAEEGLSRADPDAFLMGFHAADPERIAQVAQAVLDEANRLSGQAWEMRALMKKARLPRLGKALGRDIPGKT